MTIMNTPHANASTLSFMDSFRATFYFVTPSETMFEHPNQVPNYVAAAFPHLFIIIMIEMGILAWKGKRNFRINDQLTSVSAGICREVLRLLGIKTIEFSMYLYVYTHYRIYELPWDSYWTWVIMALALDFFYYWFHRAAHEVSVFWMLHQTHHSSEEYTLSTSLRQSAIQAYGSSFAYLPAALFIPPSSYLVHRQLNLLYQFWIHTELVDSLGPLEYILNTPSHHRVHHGRNRYCVDKNYAAVLIIWDRMFGTFQAEKRDEKVVYGLVNPIGTFDGLTIQFSHGYVLAKRFWKADGIGNKLSVLFKGPGWTEGSPRLGNPEDIPNIKHPVKVYDPEVSSLITAYVLCHSLLSFAIFNAAAKFHLVMPAPAVYGACVYFLSTITCSGYIFDKRSFAYATEFVRCVMCFFILYVFRADMVGSMSVNERIVDVVTAAFGLSASIWPIIMIWGGMTLFKIKSS